MKKHVGAVLVAALVAVGCRPPDATATATTSAEAPQGEAAMTIQRSGSRPTGSGPPANFTGIVTVIPLFDATEHRHASAASVSFSPSARSAWHSHPGGQTLIVTSGSGWIQQWGREKQEIQVGDVIWTPPGVKHWHGGTSTTAMTHIAMQEAVGGKVVDWMEHVSDQQYGAATTSAAATTTAPTVRIAELEIDPARLADYLAIVRPEMDAVPLRLDAKAAEVTPR